MVNKALLATDGSENALRAARQAAELMKSNPGLKVTALYVRTPASNLLKFEPWVLLQDIEKEMHKLAGRAIEKTVSLFQEQGLAVDSEIVAGEPGVAIADYAKKNGFGWIIMGTRGLSDLSGVIMGSVSHQVLHLTELPVLLVK
ncbi:MAG: universal stress protein [Firmicutes bacterium]|nr:universal stress protein [Bacillota bacterium]